MVLIVNYIIYECISVLVQIADKPSVTGKHVINVSCNCLVLRYLGDYTSINKFVAIKFQIHFVNQAFAFAAIRIQGDFVFIVLPNQFFYGLCVILFHLPFLAIAEFEQLLCR